MRESHSSSEAHTLKAFYAAINRNDIAAALELTDPEFERIEPEGFPMSGTYRGHAVVLEHFKSARATWAEGACEPERFLVIGNKAVVSIHVRVRLKDQEAIEWANGTP